ncbi:MAG: hypothetical protein RL467_257, partial [Actinomycetota bacterium]
MIELAASFDAQLSTLTPYLIYLIVGAIVFFETAVLFAFFLPGDSILFSSGLVAAAHEDVNILILVSVIFIAAFFGDQIGFVLGRLVGRPYLERHDSPRMRSMIARSERFYEHTGWWAVVAARFFPWIRTFVPPIAGASNMNYYKFLTAYSLVSVFFVVWIILV